MTLKKILRKESLSSSDLIGRSSLDCPNRSGNDRGVSGNNSAQASLEYFILLSLIAILTILSFSSFFVSLKGSAQGKDGFFQRAAERIM